MRTTSHRYTGPIRALRRRVSAALAAALVCVLTISAGPAAAKKDRDELEAERSANISKLDEIREQKEGVNDELQQAYLELEQTKADLPLAEFALEEAEDVYVTAKRDHERVVEDLTAAEQLREDIQGEILSAAEAAQEAKEGLNEIARVAMMREPLAQSDLMLLLGATTLEALDVSYMAADAVTRNRTQILAAAQEDVATNKNREARLGAVTEDIARLEAAARTAMDEAEQAKQAALDAKQTLDTLVSMQTLQARALQDQLEAFTQQEEQIKANQAALEADLRALAEQERTAWPDGGPPMSP